MSLNLNEVETLVSWVQRKSGKILDTETARAVAGAVASWTEAASRDSGVPWYERFVLHLAADLLAKEAARVVPTTPPAAPTSGA